MWKKLKIIKIPLYVLLFLTLLITFAESNTICDKCGETITGTYWEIEGKNYCNKCYEENAPRCDNCREILSGTYRISGDKKYCNSCYESIAPRCSICRQILEGTYQTSLDGKKQFCQKCCEAHPPCCNCFNPAGPTGLSLNDGRHICFDCYTVAIFTEENIQKIFEEAKTEMKQLLNMKVNYPVKEISLVDKNKLNEIYHKQTIEYAPEEGVSGIHYYEKINGKVTVSEIYILSGLTPGRALDVVAHEYSHAWQAENCPDNQNIKRREGFAEWVSYKILKSRGYDLEASIKLKTQDPIYGKGLNEFLEIEKEFDIKGVFNYAKGIDRENLLNAGNQVIKMEIEKTTEAEEEKEKLSWLPVLKLITFSLSGILILFILIYIYLKIPQNNK